MNRKIKIFLGGYTNYTNAQNLNCRAIAQYLDKTKFEVYTLETSIGKLESIKNKDIHIFHCLKPHRISNILGYLWGIWHGDVVYLPKGEYWKLNRFLLKLFHKKSFTTVEGIFDEENLKSATDFFKTYSIFLESFSFFDKKFAISSFVQSYNFKNHNIETEKEPLFLGVDFPTVSYNVKQKDKKFTIIYIGRLKKRKGVYDILELAKHYREIDFLLYGDGEERVNLEQEIQQFQLLNVFLKGVVSHKELRDEILKSNLHILPSRSEGFPKVTLETAAAGVPSIVYSDYGATEWIKTGENGWVVNDIEEIKNIINKLIEDPELLKINARGAIEMAKKFDWKIVIKNWEEVIKSLIENK